MAKAKMKHEERVEVDVLLLPIATFAKMLGVSVWTARSWAYRGKVSSVKLLGGRLLQIPHSEVDRLIAEGMRPRIAKPTRRPRCAQPAAAVASQEGANA